MLEEVYDLAEKTGDQVIFDTLKMFSRLFQNRVKLDRVKLLRVAYYLTVFDVYPQVRKESKSESCRKLEEILLRIG